MTLKIFLTIFIILALSGIVYTVIDNKLLKKIITRNEQLTEANFRVIKALKSEVEYAKEIKNIRQRNAQLDGWILCSESLPKNSDWVIVTILDENGDTPYRYTDFGWYLKAANCWIVYAEQRTDVTAWMPLPEPYKGGDKE